MSILYGIVLMTADGDEQQYIEKFDTWETAEEYAKFLNNQPTYWWRDGVPEERGTWYPYKYKEK